MPRAVESGAKPSCTTVSLTISPSSSISNVTFERGSAASLAATSSAMPALSAHSGVKVCQVYDSRRCGVDSRTTCSGWAVVAPRSVQAMVDPLRQSVANSTPQ
ncbi:hypothetical protein GZL_00937 [Streptomyces sp. 769]|nr:hypothetical protein GZL_00937 [Streptomyces sp. 769]